MAGDRYPRGIGDLAMPPQSGEFSTGELLLLSGRATRPADKNVLECTNEFRQVKGQGCPKSVLGFVPQICALSNKKMLPVTESEQAGAGCGSHRSIFLLDTHDCAGSSRVSSRTKKCWWMFG